jgi:hypothetical protein
VLVLCTGLHTKSPNQTNGAAACSTPYYIYTADTCPPPTPPRPTAAPPIPPPPPYPHTHSRVTLSQSRMSAMALSSVFFNFFRTPARPVSSLHTISQKASTPWRCRWSKPPRFVPHVRTKGDSFPQFCFRDICFFQFAYTKKTFADFAAAAQRTATARGGNDVGHEGPNMGGAPSHIFLRGSAVCPGRHAQGFLYQIREKRPCSWWRPHVCVHFVHILSDVRFRAVSPASHATPAGLWQSSP